MIYNVIGPPGAGKTTYIQTRFGFSPPMREIDDEVFEAFAARKVFEHTGLNPRINQYLKASGETITTIWFQTPIHACLYRIVKDWFKGKASFRQTVSRIKILCFYHKHSGEIIKMLDNPRNTIVVVP